MLRPSRGLGAGARPSTSRDMHAYPPACLIQQYDFANVISNPNSLSPLAFGKIDVKVENNQSDMKELRRDAVLIYDFVFVVFRRTAYYFFERPYKTGIIVVSR